MIPIKYNTRNLVVRWKTTLLTAVGFTLVVALLVVMLAFVEGLNELSRKTGPEGNIIILRDGANDELFSDIAVDAKVVSLYNQPEVLTDETGEKLASKEVYSVATQELPPKTEGGRPQYRFLQVRGIELPIPDGQVPLAAKVHDLELKPGGRWLDRTGTQVVMGEAIAGLLGVSVGDRFKIRPDLEWQVVGILDSRGSPFDSEIWGKLEDVGRYFGKDSEKQTFYTSIVVRTENAQTAEKFARELQDRVPDLRIRALPERKYYEEMSKSNQMFLGAALFIAVIMAIGGMFGLMNTMFAAVSQRIKDIGVLRILGFGRGQILVSFLLESLLLALVGGALGVLLGLACHGVEQTSFVTSGQGGGKTVVFKMVVNQSVLTLAGGFTLAMGVLGGLLPSLSAMRLKVLDTLR